MAVLEFKFHHNLKKSLDYVTKDRDDEGVISGINCEPEDAVEQFRATKQLHEKSDGNQIFRLIQSFPPNERNLKTPEEFNELGKRLTERLFPGYEAVVRTHTDKGHIHNHIDVNTIHPQTGVRIGNEKQWGQVFGPPANKAAMDLPEVAAFAAVYRASKMPENYQKKMVHVLRAENDAVAREAGLSVIEGKRHEPPTIVPKGAMKREQLKKDSWVLDLMQKANYARAYATSYDEYQGLMRETFKIDVRVENKNIIYNYPGTQKRVMRGKSMGEKFDKKRLEETFAFNDRQFANRPDLRNTLRAEINTLQNHKGGIVRDSGGVLLEPGGARTIFTKDYGAFTPGARSGRTPRTSSELDLSRSIIPIGEIRRARGSVLDYCKKNNIGVKAKDDGTLVLKGREHVTVTHEGFVNTRSNVQGSLIDFVSIHQSLTYVQSIAKINNNPRLLLLEQYWGERKRSFNAFYVPKQEQAPHEKALAQASKLLRTWGASEKTARGLMERNQLHVSSHGVIRIFGSEDGGGALEFRENEHGQWQTETKGKIRRGLYEGKPKGKLLQIIVDPKQFIARHGEAAFGKKPALHGVLALLSPESEPVDRYVNEHREVSKVLLLFSNKTPSKDELDFFGVLKKRYQHLNIEVEATSHRLEQTLGRKGPELSR